MSTNSGLLVTGAGGLLGRTLVSHLAQNEPVTAVYRQAPLPPSELKHVTPFVHDLTKPLDKKSLAAHHTVIHLAQSSFHRDFPAKALDVFEVNVGSTQRILDWAVQNGVKRFVYASTGGVYKGGPDPCSEASAIKSGFEMNHYVAGKLAGELLAQSYSQKMIVILLRFFFIYGPGQKEEMLVPRLIDSVISGRPITLHGENGIRINPIHARDAAAAVGSAARMEKSEIINVAGQEILTIKDIGLSIGEKLGIHPKFQMKTELSQNSLIANNERMKNLLHVPSINFSAGLKSMLNPFCPPGDK